MARRFQRRRWRRPQRLTLEGPPPTRRKDVAVADLLTLEPSDVRRENRRRMGVLLGTFLVLSAAEGLAAGLPVHAPWTAGAGAALAFLYLFAGARFGDGWMRGVLRASPADLPGPANLAAGLAQRSGVATPELLVAEGEAPNTISLGLRRPWLLVTSGFCALGRLEQEALLAREIVHVRSGDSALASAFVLIGGAVELAAKALRARGGVLAVLSVPVWPACLVVRALSPLLAPHDREHRTDVAGALLTRYPPGMRRALHAAAVDQSPSRLSATDPFWAAPRAPAGGPSVERRADLVSEM